MVKTSLKSKVSIFVEFSLQLLADILKVRNFQQNNEKDEDSINTLNMFIPLIIDSLKLKFDKATFILLNFKYFRLLDWLFVV